ncbi:MAG: hypothetical protein AAF355_07950 [Myxococcota bacterium]
MTEHTPPKLELLGRRVGATVAGTATIYLVFIGFYSILPQVFYPASGPPKDCETEMPNLVRELRDFELSQMDSPDPPLKQTQWYRSWDRRHRAIRASCSRDPQLRNAHEKSERLRHLTQTSLLRYRSRQAPLIRDIEAAFR